MTNTYKYIGAAAITAALIAAGIWSTGKNNSLRIAFAPEISKIGSSAFGSLTAQDSAGAEQANESDSEKATSSIAPLSAKYKYSGDKFELNDVIVPVLRRKTGQETSASVANQIKNMNLGIADLSSFVSAKMQNFSFYEDKDFGYYVDVNFRDNSISIYENWEKWDNPLTRCADDQKCYDANNLTINDIPPDQELISIANIFLSQYGISMDSYGKPEVVNDWRISYDAAEDKQYAWVPDQMQVRYPLMIEEEAVYDQGGNVFGLTVNVNVRHKRAAGVWGLRANQFESSDYEAITDVEKVIAYAEAGGMTGAIYYEQNSMTNVAQEVELGTPERVLVQTYNYAGGQSNELLVPALRFPIITKIDDPTFFWRNSVIVPLAKELIPDLTLPEPKPLPVDDVIIMETGASDGSDTAPVPPATQNLPEGADAVEVEE